MTLVIKFTIQSNDYRKANTEQNWNVYHYLYIIVHIDAKPNTILLDKNAVKIVVTCVIG